MSVVAWFVVHLYDPYCGIRIARECQFGTNTLLGINRIVMTLTQIIIINYGISTRKCAAYMNTHTQGRPHTHTDTHRHTHTHTHTHTYIYIYVYFFSWRYNPLWLYFHSPVPCFSLLVFEVSRSHTTTRHSQ